jgi:hypothetical protein
MMGTIAKVEWINPHSYITIDAKDASGKVERWAFRDGGARRSAQGWAEQGKPRRLETGGPCDNHSPRGQGWFHDGVSPGNNFPGRPRFQIWYGR